LLPPLLAAEIRGMPVAALVLLAACALTDLLDGRAARRMEQCSRFGALFDVSADFALVFSLYLLYVARGLFPLGSLLLALILLSVLSFALCCLLKKRFVKQRLGRYTGALLLAGMLWLFVIRLFSARLHAASLPVVAAVVIIGLLLSLAENLLFLACRRKKKASPPGEA
jgi:phosphatidylglycerophosphate synthase